MDFSFKFLVSLNKIRLIGYTWAFERVLKKGPSLPTASLTKLLSLFLIPIR